MLEQLFGLKGKVCLVTGGNGGIGLGMAKALASAGADVVIWGTNPEKNSKALEEISKFGTRVAAMNVDVSNEDQIIENMAKIIENFGRIDTIIANSGIARPARSFMHTSTQNWRDVMAVNLDGVFWTFREGLKYMVERAKNGDMGGSLVVTSSISAYFGMPANEAYPASKAAVISLIKGLAVEYARFGIRANAICPGWVETDMTKPLQESDKFGPAIISRVPQGRWGNADEFGGIAIYLASNASSFHTGDEIKIDGGYAIG